MKKVFFAALAVCLLVSGALPVLAQQAPPRPPNVLQIFREEVKPGKGAAHEKVEMGWPRAFAKANSSTYYLAVTSISGPTEAWFITGYDSLAAWEKDSWANDSNPTLSAELQQLSAQDGELLSGVRSVVANYREEMSYQPSGTPPLGQMRYFYVTTVRVRPGHESEYEQINKITREAHQKANIPERWSAWQVNYGMPRGTFIIFQPLKSLADVDAFPQTHGEAYQATIGEEGAKKLRELTNSAILTSETNIVAFSPKMSYPRKEWVEADRQFWTPKPVAAKKATP